MPVITLDLSGLDGAIALMVWVMGQVIIRTKKAQEKESMLATVCITLTNLSLIAARVYLTKGF